MNPRLLLGLEATGSVGGVALLQEGVLLGSVRLAHGMNLSGSLLRAAEWLLRWQQTALARVDAFVVDVGPGAFTGLKIGVMIAKSWAHALSKPLIAVNAFEACAALMPVETPTLVALPARRDALYLQWLQPRDGAVPEPLSEPAFVLQGALGDWLAQHTPSASLLQAVGVLRAREWIAPLVPGLRWRLIDSPSPEGVVAIGWQRYHEGAFVHPFSLTPLYLQPPSIHLKTPS